MVYNYTKPRRPIAAMFNSPGPCYQLPGLTGYSNHDPRSVHNREASWSFGVRHGKFSDECSPGPCYLPQSKIYTDGKDGTPQYSLYSRPKEAMLYAVPGPGAYSPTLGDVQVYPKVPAYSLSSRNKPFRTDDVPGPNVYNLDPMLCKTVRSQKPAAPSYSLSSRTKIFGQSEVCSSIW
ncbi:unnamed protein product [Calicophoron daubneyi]|uniref:Outer dense fiber protein 3-like protein 2 n=1 Tax=Calicophoron daubneyi TaxID=300641 RepID=A0AAV2T584_CALDB